MPRGGRAGRHAQRTANTLALRAQLTLALAALTAWASVTHAPAPLAPYGLAGAAAIALASRLRARTARRWQHGAAGERLVARRLRRLPRTWTVLHDIDRGRGNIDHIAIGPHGVFTIETKLHHAGSRELQQARGHAAWCAKRTGRPATAVLCVALGTSSPKQYACVWVMGPRHLPRFLRRHRGARLDVDHVAARLI